jgi:xylulokinase
MYLGFDLGTSSVKAVVADETGRIVASGTSPVERRCTPDGGVEQDIEQIWEAACAAIGQSTRDLGAAAIRAIGVSSQGGALQLLDGQERPVGAVISWLDGRGRPFDRELAAELGEDFLAEHVGHGSSAMTLGQVLRLRREAPQSLLAPNRLGFVGDVIVGRLCGRRAHDPTSLGIALLYNPWLERADPQVLLRLGIEETQLPDLVPATQPAGQLRPEVARRFGLSAGIPVSPAVHDQYATALGAGSVAPGDTNFGAGTAWVLLANSDRLARPIVNEAFVCSHPVPGVYGQMLSMSNGGSAIEWAMRLTGQERPALERVDDLAGSVPAGSHGLRFWPLLVSGAAAAGPFHAGGRLDGLALSHGPAHLARAVIEGLACELARHLAFLTRAGLAVNRLSMCGTAAASRVTPQVIADVTGLPVACIEASGVSAFGAAMIARALIDPAPPLPEVASRWAPASRTVRPGRNAAVYRELLERYLAPFLASGVTHSFSALPRAGEGNSGASGRPQGAIPLHHVWTYTDVDRAFWQEHLEPWLPARIFDAHTHINEPCFLREKPTEEKRRQYWVNEVLEPIGAADAQRCFETVFAGREFGCLCFGFPSLEFDIERSNASLNAECVKRGWNQLAVVRPQWTADRVAQELDRPRVIGVKVYYSLISHDPATRDKHREASIFEFLPRHQLELLNERGAWVTLHVPKAERLGHPENIAQIKEIRRRWPRVVLVIAHLGRCYTLSHAEEALPQLADDEGLLFDSSAVVNRDVSRFALKTLGPKRILYGSDNPVFYMRGRRQFRGRTYINRTSYPFFFNRQRESPEVEAGYTLYMYEDLRALRRACEDLGLDRGDVEDIFYRNAQRVIDSIHGYRT